MITTAVVEYSEIRVMELAAINITIDTVMGMKLILEYGPSSLWRN